MKSDVITDLIASISWISLDIRTCAYCNYVVDSIPAIFTGRDSVQCSEIDMQKVSAQHWALNCTTLGQK